MVKSLSQKIIKFNKCPRDRLVANLKTTWKNKRASKEKVQDFKKKGQ